MLIHLTFSYVFFLFVADFDMSEAQIEHAITIEGLAPRLAALRFELCPIHMSEDSFWKIYFVLLHPRLSKHDADLLSTPQVSHLTLHYFICYTGSILHLPNIILSIDVFRVLKYGAKQVI